MPKSTLPKERLEQIVAEQMPGFTLADDPDPDVVPHAAAQYTSPALDALRRKYLADAPDYVEVAEAASFTAGTAATDAALPDAQSSAADDLGMIRVETRTVDGDARDAVHPTRKAAVVSSATGRIIGAQG